MIDRIVKIGMIVPISLESFMEGPVSGRDGHLEITPKTPAWLAERAAFVAEWQRLTAEGEALGFLEREPCYECGGELRPTQHTEDTKWVDG